MSLTLRTGLIYALFAATTVLATVPVWRLFVFGIHPALDELLAIFCRTNPI
jgi:hypothetical protein